MKMKLSNSEYTRMLIGFLAVISLAVPQVANAQSQGIRISVSKNVPGGRVGRGIAVTPNGQQIYSPSSNATVDVIDTITFNRIAAIPICQNPAGIAISRDGAYAYVASGCPAVTVIRISDNAVVKTLNNVVGNPWGIATSPDGQYVYITDDANGSDAVAILRTSDNSLVRYISGVGNRSRGIAITPDGRHIYITSFASSTISVIDTSLNQVIKSIPVTGGSSLGGVAVTSDGRFVYALNGQQLLVIRTLDNNLEATISMPSSAASGESSIGFTLDGAFAFVSAGLFHVIRISDHSIVHSLDTSDAGAWNDFAAIAVSPTQNQIYVANSIDGIISIITYENTYSISGSVSGGGNQAIPNVTIFAQPGISAVTDANGRYSINDLTAGTYNLALSKLGFIFSTNESPQVTVPPGATRNFVGIRVQQFVKPHANYIKFPGCDFGDKPCASKDSFHTGIDSQNIANGLVTSVNVPIIAVADGIVVFASEGNNNKLGNTVILKHTLADGSEIFTQYSHMAKKSLTVSQTDVDKGTCIKQGVTIGVMGNTPEWKAVHLHFEIKLSALHGSPNPPNKYFGYTPQNPETFGYINPNNIVGGNYRGQDYSPLFARIICPES